MRWNDLSTASLDDIVAWADDQPWCRAMAACQQDSEWHAEGDVWTHTKMVCAELPKLTEWSALTPHERTVLIFTALFHDAAKPLTSKIDPVTGRVTSHKHAVKGEGLVRSALRDLGCGLDVREQIARMVRFHGRPVFLLDKPEPSHEVVSLSWSVNNKLLYLFALADARGRHTDDGRPEENLHFWKMLAEEHDCLEKPYQFGNDQARFQFFRQQDDRSLHYVPHEEYRCTVTMMSGLPGSGKDTWLAKNRGDLPTVSLDDVRDELDIEATENQGQVAQLAKERCRELLRSRTSFAFNATNVMRTTRQRWVDLFVDYQARIEMVYLEPALSTVISQNKRRERTVPESVILRLAGKLEPPTWTEAHGLIVSDGS